MKKEKKKKTSQEGRASITVEEVSGNLGKLRSCLLSNTFLCVIECLSNSVIPVVRPRELQY